MCSRDWLGIGVATVILADISANTVCSAGGFCRHRAFVSMSEWVRCSAANCANPSACASCCSAPLMFSAWIRSILTTFQAISMIPMPLRVFIFILIPYCYPFITSIAPGAIRICRDWNNQEIADYLRFSPNTVKTYLSRIYVKLNIKKRDELKKYML